MPDRIFEEKVYVVCEVQEMVDPKSGIYSSPHINLKNLFGDDDEPLVVSIKLVSDGSVGFGRIDGESMQKRYTPEFVSQVAESINPKSNSDSIKLYPGHQKPEDVGYELRKVLGVFVGGQKLGSTAVGHCYIMPSAGELREQIRKRVFPKVSIEARAKMKHNLSDGVIEVFELEQLKGVAIANDADVGVERAGITKVIQEMTGERREEQSKMGDEIKGTDTPHTQTPPAPAPKVVSISEMSADDIIAKRPDVAEKIRKNIDADLEVEGQIDEMQADIEKQKTALTSKDKEIEGLKTERDKLSSDIQEMKTQEEVKQAKVELMSKLDYPKDILSQLDKDIVGKTVEEMTSAKDRAIERLEALGIKPGQKKKEETPMITGVSENSGHITEMHNLAPTMGKREVMQLLFSSHNVSFDEKYKVFGGNVVEMRNYYTEHGSDDVKHILSCTFEEMQTRTDFPDLLEYGLEPLLIDSYFSEVQETKYQEFFTPFTMTRNSLPFPSMKGFQIGKIVEGEAPPIVSLKPGPKTTITVEDFGALIGITHAMMRDGEVDLMRYNVMELGRAHARKKDSVAAYLLANGAGQIIGPVANTIGNLRAARISGLEIYETDTGIKRPKRYNSIIISPARLEELVPTSTTAIVPGIAIDPRTGDVTGIAGMKCITWLEIPDDFTLLVVAKDKMLECIRETLSIANAEDFKTRSEMVRSGEAYTFAILDADNVMKVEFTP